MDEQQHTDNLFQITGLITDQLTDGDLAGVGLCISLGNDPRNMPQWEKAKALFTASDENGVPIIHDLAKEMFFHIYTARLITPMETENE